MNLIQQLLIGTIFLINSYGSYSQEVKEVKDVFEECIELNNNFLISLKKEDRQKSEEYSETYLKSALIKFECQMFSKFDKELHLLFVELLTNTTNSANELPYSSLLKIYVAYPEETLNAIFLSKERESILSSLESMICMSCNELKHKIKALDR